MRRLPGHLLPLCLMGALLLYTSSAQEYYDTDYDATPIPDYDYNATFDYIFYSNTSEGTLDLEEILKGRGTKISEEKEIKDNAPCCSSPSLWLFHSLLLVQLCRLLCAWPATQRSTAQHSTAPERCPHGASSAGRPRDFQRVTRRDNAGGTISASPAGESKRPIHNPALLFDCSIGLALLYKLPMCCSPCASNTVYAAKQLAYCRCS